MNELSPEQLVKLFKALADQSRVKILATLLEEPKYVELIAERLALTPSTVSFHLKKLEEVGLVEKKKDQYYIVYSIRLELLELPLIELLEASQPMINSDEQRELAYRSNVLKQFIKYDQLISIPVQRKKRKIILEHIVESFEPNTPYPEKEVNRLLSQFHEDFALLRRSMIEEQLMERKDGIYLRVHSRS
ncbi:MAG: hypothetical protein BGO41_14650 [Clostridiales bacterium 38-18]|nr:MAG: hypothetical protein BGO41_14650 [Clostridiales bacterium 38-18]